MRRRRYGHSNSLHLHNLVGNQVISVHPGLGPFLSTGRHGSIDLHGWHFVCSSMSADASLFHGRWCS